ncbi:MAG: glutamate formiminotransferase [Thermoleophilia bacterium]|nr:glutamate formiminotransferase [Thermoleophilia bacterium]
MFPLESVPNVSEGRSAAVVRTIGQAYVAAGAALLDTHFDADHHRAVHTLVAVDGEDATLVDALVTGVVAAVAAIDLGRHEGVHPRVGAADVVPLVALRPEDLPRACAAARAVAERVGEELGVPVFLYGEVGEGQRLAFFRRGGPQALQRRVDAGEIAPAFGPRLLHPTAGATLVGVRAPLVAFNVELEGPTATDVARAIAGRIRASGGGLPGLQAIGLELGSSGRAQVSMNLIDLSVCALHEVVARVRAEAASSGVRVTRGELVGLLPALEVARAAGEHATLGADGLPTVEALAAAAAVFLLPSLRPDRVIEWHLARLGLVDSTA